MPIENLLLLHGNGGAASRFELFRSEASRRGWPLRIVVPELPGFEGRPLPDTAASWAPFLTAVAEAVAPYAVERWAVYGHGIGGSLLLEWAARGWPLPDDTSFTPERVLLHAPVGASLRHRFFPRLMRPRPVRHFVHWMIYQPALQRIWERKLFLFPERIPAALRQQFFADYRHCAAFSTFFDLITPAWYDSVLRRLPQRNFHFIWGERERVIASEFVDYWRQDFPDGKFTIVPDWDHFPMLEQVPDFTDRLAAWLNLDL